MILTKKKSLVTTTKMVPASYMDLKPDMQLEGFIIAVKDTGVAVAFCNDVRVRVVFLVSGGGYGTVLAPPLRFILPSIHEDGMSLPQWLDEKNSHICKNLTQNGEPQRYCWRRQKKKNSEPQRYCWRRQKKKNGEPQRYCWRRQKKKNCEPQRYCWRRQKKKNGEPQRYC